MSILNVKYFDHLFNTNSQTENSQLRESEVKAMMAILNGVISDVKELEKKQEVSKIGGSL